MRRLPLVLGLVTIVSCHSDIQESEQEWVLSETAEVQAPEPQNDTPTPLSNEGIRVFSLEDRIVPAPPGPPPAGLVGSGPSQVEIQILNVPQGECHSEWGDEICYTDVMTPSIAEALAFFDGHKERRFNHFRDGGDEFDTGVFVGLPQMNPPTMLEVPSRGTVCYGASHGGTEVIACLEKDTRLWLAADTPEVPLPECMEFFFQFENNRVEFPEACRYPIPNGFVMERYFYDSATAQAVRFF